MNKLQPSDHLSHLSYDNVIFGFSGERLKKEDLDEAVKRGLRERTGLKDLHLEQFHTFGSMRRVQPEVMRTILEASDFSPENAYWLLKRFVSVGYYTLIDYHQVSPTPDALADSLEWYPVEELPPLLFDHEEIVKKALQSLRRNLDAMLVGVNMLPDLFTIKELQQVHEAILGETLNRTAFQRRMLNTGTLLRHEKRYAGGSHRAPYLYSFVRK